MLCLDNAKAFDRLQHAFMIGGTTGGVERGPWRPSPEEQGRAAITRFGGGAAAPVVPLGALGGAEGGR